MEAITTAFNQAIAALVANRNDQALSRLEETEHLLNNLDLLPNDIPMPLRRGPCELDIIRLGGFDDFYNSQASCSTHFDFFNHAIVPKLNDGAVHPSVFRKIMQLCVTFNKALVYHKMYLERPRVHHLRASLRKYHECFDPSWMDVSESADLLVVVLATYNNVGQLNSMIFEPSKAEKCLRRIDQMLRAIEVGSFVQHHLKHLQVFSFTVNMNQVEVHYHACSA